MKKLSLVMAAAMCLTVGGVYATWSYSEGQAGFAQTNVTVSLEGVDVSTNSKGGIHTTPDSVAVIIDQKAANDYSAVLKWGETNDKNIVTATYTPADSTADTTIVMEVTITETLGKYGDIDLITLTDYLNTSTPATATKDENGNDTITFILNNGVATSETTFDLSKCITLGAIQLPNYDAYTAFYNYLGTTQRRITVTVHEKVIADSTENQ